MESRLLTATGVAPLALALPAPEPAAAPELPLPLEAPDIGLDWVGVPGRRARARAGGCGRRGAFGGCALRAAAACALAARGEGAPSDPLDWAARMVERSVAVDLVFEASAEDFNLR